MKKFKLIKCYPNSQRLGFIFCELEYPNSIFNKITIKAIQEYPEFWEEI